MNWQQFLHFISSLDNGISSIRLIYINPLSEHAAVELNTDGYLEYKLYSHNGGLAEMVLFTSIKDEIEKSINDIEAASIKSYLISYMFDGDTFECRIPEYSEADAIGLFLKTQGFNFIPDGFHIFNDTRNQLSRERLIEIRENLMGQSL